MIQGVGPGQLLLLYDGVCGLCHGLVQWAIAHDRHDCIVFAALQGGTAARVLKQHGRDPADLDSVLVVEPRADGKERLLARADAVARLLCQLRGPWALLGRLLAWVPKPLATWGYNQVAKRRYRLFGRYEACPLPTPAQRSKFLA